MKRVLEVLIKELRQLKRDRRMLPILFVLPIVQLVIFGFAVSTDVRHVRLAVYDTANCRESRELVSTLVNSGYFDLAGYCENYDALEREIDKGNAAVGLVFPPNYEKNLVKGETAQLLALVDGSDSNTGTIALGYLSKAVQDKSVDLITRKLMKAGMSDFSLGGIEQKINIWFNPGLESKKYMVPGVMCNVVGMITMILTALAIVKEREIGTIEQLIVTPIKSWELILGKMLPFLLVGYINIAVTLLASALVFHVYVLGNLLLLLGLSGIFLMSSLGLGMLISTVSNTQQQALMASVFFLFPNILLSGFAFPISSMPVFLQWVTHLLPMRYFLVIVRNIMLKGSSFNELWAQIVPLTALTFIIIVLAIMRFKKRLD